jgi:tellurite resistance protein TerC
MRGVPGQIQVFTRSMTFPRALAWSIFWIGLSLLATLGVRMYFGSAVASAFLTGYTLEKALSVDNLFVFLMVFSYFKVDRHAQRRVLNWGIIGVLILRGILIFLGLELVERFEWLMYIFGAIVVYTGFVMAFGKDQDEFHPDKNLAVRIARRLFTVSRTQHGERFFVREAGRRMVTPLFVVLIVIELTDVVFAVDSIPAIFAVTRDPFVVYGSNVLAVLGLRSLYFLLERMHNAFRFVKAGVGVILWFVGVKMLMPLFWPHLEIPNILSLFVILAVLTISIILSVLIKPKRRSRS